MNTRLVSIALEGACDFFFGRPREENPYNPEDSDHWESWAWGWDDAHALNEHRGDEERARWLRKPAA